MNEEQTKVVSREVPEVDDARAALVKARLDEITTARAHWEKRFNRMRKNQKFVRGVQWNGQEDMDDDDRYIANITHRHIQQRKSSLYAKNPRIVAKPRQRMEFKIWDGDRVSLEQAMLSMQPQQVQMPDGSTMMAQGQPDPTAQALLADVQEAKIRRALLKRIGKTLEIVYNYQLSEPRPKFKTQAKQAVNRCLTNGVAYCKLGYQRLMGHKPGWQSGIADFSARIAELERLSADVADGEIFDGQAEMEELRLKLAALQSEPEIVLREGLLHSFPASTAIIVDTACTQLRGFVGAGWVAEEYNLTTEQIQEMFKVDVSGSYTRYNRAGDKVRMKGKAKSLARVYERYDLVGQTLEYLCEGYPDFLQEPGPCDIKMEQVHPYFVLVFNEIEDEDDIYPPSNVDLIRSMQLEINRSGESKREHRIGARPATVGAQGVLGVDDKFKLATHATNEHIELGIPQGVKVSDVLQAKPTAPFDPNLYETETTFGDVLRTMGDAEANFGGTAGDTATESTIAENSRMSTIESNKDDLDEWLTEIAQSAGQVLLYEMSTETAAKIAGVGAAWPEQTRSEIAEEILLEIAAGSSGRPNRSLDIANFERLAPIAIQIPGLRPEPMARRAAVLLDQEAELDDWVIEGIPSITSMNSVKQVPTGEPGNEPDKQGPEGQDNAPRGEQSQPGPQGQFPLQ